MICLGYCVQLELTLSYVGWVDWGAHPEQWGWNVGSLFLLITVVSHPGDLGGVVLFWKVQIKDISLDWKPTSIGTEWYNYTLCKTKNTVKPAAQPVHVCLCTHPTGQKLSSRPVSAWLGSPSLDVEGGDGRQPAAAKKGSRPRARRRAPSLAHTIMIATLQLIFVVCIKV